jgi:hypothetical protein
MPQQAEVNRFVIDYLRRGPAEVETLYSAAFKWGRAPRGMVNGALMHFKVRRLVRPEDDAKFVEIPDKLVAIWWAKRQPALSHAGTARGGGSAA